MISSWEPGSLMWLLSKPSLSVVPLHMAYALPGPCCSCTAIMLEPTKKIHTSLSVHASATAGDTFVMSGGFHHLEPDYACNSCCNSKRQLQSSMCLHILQHNQSLMSPCVYGFGSAVHVQPCLRPCNKVPCVSASSCVCNVCPHLPNTPPEVVQSLVLPVCISHLRSRRKLRPCKHTLHAAMQHSSPDQQ